MRGIRVEWFAAVAVLIGICLLLWGWSIAGAKEFGPNVLAELGGALLLFAPLYLLERRLERRVTVVSDEVRRLREPAPDTERSRAREEHGVTLVSGEQTMQPVSELPPGTYGFVDADYLDGVIEGTARLGSYGDTTTLEVHKALDGQLIALVYAQDEVVGALTDTDESQRVVVFPERWSEATQLVRLHVSRVVGSVSESFEPEPGRRQEAVRLDVLPLLPSGAAPASELDQRRAVRERHGVEHVDPEQMLVELRNLPNGVYGFTVPWRASAVVSLKEDLKTRGGTLKLEAHKARDGSVYLIVFGAPETARLVAELAGPATVRVRSELTTAATTLIEIPVAFVKRVVQADSELIVLDLEPGPVAAASP